jgi:hypothetical protein
VNVVNVYHSCNVLFSNLSGEIEENYKNLDAENRVRELYDAVSSAVYANLKE